MSTTRAKFQCYSVTKTDGRGYSGNPEFIYEAVLSAVYGDSPENKAFFASTPTGQIKLGTVREDHFKPGKAYFVDFTEVDA